MRQTLAALAIALLPSVTGAEAPNAVIAKAVDGHVLPAFSVLAESSEALKAAALADCIPTSGTLLDAYHESFDSWIAASHLRFGPTEVEDRAFALAFWPDTKGFTPKTLAGLIRAQDPDGLNPEAYSHVSIAARGYFALEFMLYDDAMQSLGDADYRCALIRTIAADIDANADAILDGWTNGYAQLLKQPTEGRIYRSEDEAVQELFKALLAGLQFTAETRLGRPLGTFERPRPQRAEARRSERSLRNVMISLEATRDLAVVLSGEDATLARDLESAFDEALALAESLDDPTFASVSAPQGHLKVEILQQSINLLRDKINATLGAHLGVSEGFNALDGD
ncbi:imelysin family protein [Lentibacter sp. XHP0401]|uniref:imelysin family protein n=1 Tax=Lentibacter sp. XHP0401 TaxID=2984334 RepID=UPI0021E7CFA5|nr:imelysin family protein [Lentibacter sp. XHP0401]MCV2894243.1 imelysin family protein [Lentibacter sp. XHP0401]